VHPVRRQRLIVVLFIVVGASVAAGLAFYAMRENLNLFYSPAQIAAGEAPAGQRIRAGGMVREGSLSVAPDSLRYSFVVTDYQSDLEVHYEGILPDLFDEGQGVVATGVIDDGGVLQASEVLAKHDENYMPPEVQGALDKAGRRADGTALE